MIYTSHYESALGGITLAGNEMALIGLWFDGQKHFGATLPEEYKEKDLPIFEQTVHWMDLYFSGRFRDFYRLSKCRRLPSAERSGRYC